MNKIIYFTFLISLFFETSAFALEKPLTEEKYGLRSFISTPLSCNPVTKVTIKAKNKASFKGDKIELQKTLGLIRIALDFECNSKIKEIILIGVFNNAPIYQGLASESNGWILKDIIPKSSVASKLNTRKIHSRYPNLDNVDQCDILAAHPNDQHKEKNVYGVLDEKLNADKALDACIKAVSIDKANPRFNFQLGRSLFLLGVYDEATTYLKAALSIEYPAANYYLAMISLQDTKIDSHETIAALKRIEKKFKPAQYFLYDYNKELAAEKLLQRTQEVAKSFTFLNKKIANSSFKYSHHFNNLVSSNLLHFKDHSIVAVVSEIILGELQGWCPDTVSKADIRRVGQYIDASQSSSSYLKYAYKYQIKLSRNPIYTLFGGKNAMENADKQLREMHINDIIRRNDNLKFEFSTDVEKLIKNYDCNSNEIIALVDNIINFVETAPPYNTVSHKYWNACYNSNIKISSSKTNFCGCFLNDMRGGSPNSLMNSPGKLFYMVASNGSSMSQSRYASYMIGHDLINNFTSTANSLINKNSNLKKCTQPKDDSFNRFLNNEIDSYGRPIRQQRY